MESLAKGNIQTAFSFLLVTNLGRQVVLQHTQRIDLVFNHQGLLLVHAEPGPGGQRSSLVEHVEVAQRELQSHALFDFDVGLFLWSQSTRLAHLDRSRADIRLNRELHEVLGSLYLNRLVELEKLPTDLGKFSRGQGNKRSVLSLGDC